MGYKEPRIISDYLERFDKDIEPSFVKESSKDLEILETAQKLYNMFSHLIGQLTNYIDAQMRNRQNISQGVINLSGQVRQARDRLHFHLNSITWKSASTNDRINHEKEISSLYQLYGLHLATAKKLGVYLDPPSKSSE